MKTEFQSRRSMLARVVELAATAPLISLIVENFMNRTSYYEVDSSGARITEASYQTLDDLARVSGPLGNSLSSLSSNYRREYHKGHTRVVPYFDSKGRVHFRTEVYYTWEEPSNIPNHDLVELWEKMHIDFSGKTREISERATIDLEKMKEIGVRRQTTGRGSEGLVSLAIYGPQIAGLLLYEEAIAKIKHGDTDEQASASELVEKHDTPSQITRRSFFKMGAAFAGALVAAPIVHSNNEKRKDGKRKLEEEIERMIELSKISGEEAFTRFFGMGYDNLIARYKEQVSSARGALNSGVADSGVRDAFGKVVTNGQEMISSLERMFREGVPTDLSDAIKSTMIAKNLEDKSVSEHRAVYLGLGLTGLAVAGAITCTLVPLELLNERYANKVEKDPAHIRKMGL